jgi:hypothetical protein
MKRCYQLGPLAQWFFDGSCSGIALRFGVLATWLRRRPPTKLVLQQSLTLQPLSRTKRPFRDALVRFP